MFLPCSSWRLPCLRGPLQLEVWIAVAVPMVARCTILSERVWLEWKANEVAVIVSEFQHFYYRSGTNKNFVRIIIIIIIVVAVVIIIKVIFALPRLLQAGTARITESIKCNKKSKAHLSEF